MKIKIEKQFIDMGFGFPVYLLNVPMIKVRGIWTPKINYSKLSDLVLKLLAFKPARLTGDEVKFIRLESQMTLVEFGKRFDATHPGVIKWEKRGKQSTGMNWATEKDIRLFILENNKGAKQIPGLYRFLVEKFLDEESKTEIDLKEEKLLVA